MPGPPVEGPVPGTVLKPPPPEEKAPSEVGAPVDVLAPGVITPEPTFGDPAPVADPVPVAPEPFPKPMEEAGEGTVPSVLIDPAPVPAGAVTGGGEDVVPGGAGEVEFNPPSAGEAPAVPGVCGHAGAVSIAEAAKAAQRFACLRCMSSLLAVKRACCTASNGHAARRAEGRRPPRPGRYRCPSRRLSAA